MSTKSQTKKPSSADTPKAGLIIIGNSKQIQGAAKKNPRLAELLKKTPIQDNEDTEQVFTALEPKDRDDIIEKWEQQMRLEAKERTGKILDGSSWLDSFPTIKLGGPSKPDHQASGVQIESLEEKYERQGSQTKIEHAKAEPQSRSYQHILDRDLIKALEAIGVDEPANHQMFSSSKMIDGPRSLTTAEKLKKAVDLDMFPSDPLTRQQFGFAKVDNHEEETCVLGLYIGLFLLPRPPTLDTLQGWVAKNKLAQGIQYSYQSQMGGSHYFSWFRRNKHFFNQDYVNPNKPRAAPENGTRVNQDLFDKLTKKSGRKPGSK